MKNRSNFNDDQRDLKGSGVSNMSQVKYTILKAIYATALLTSLMLPQLATAETIQLPGDPIAPTDARECDAVLEQYRAIFNQLMERARQLVEQAHQIAQSSGSPVSQWNEMVPLYKRSEAIETDAYKIMSLGNNAKLRCIEKVNAYKTQQSAERQQQAEAQRQQAAAQQQAQQQSAIQQRSQQALNAYKQLQQGRSAINTGKSFLASPRATVGGRIASGIASLLGSLATPNTDSADADDVNDYESAHYIAKELPNAAKDISNAVRGPSEAATTNPVAKLFSMAAMEKLRLHNLGMLNTMGEVGRDIQAFGKDDIANSGSSVSSNWSWSSSNAGVPVNIPEASVNLSDPDPLGKFLDSVDTKSWDAQVTDYQTSLRESMGNKSGQIVEAMNWIDQNQSQRIQDIGNSYASASPAVDGQSQGDSGFANPSSYGGTNDKLAIASTGRQTNCEAARPYIQQANEYRKAINQIKAQESDYRSGYGSANMDQYLAMLKDGVKVNEAEAARLCPR
jgi:hypothetical protein